MLQPHLCQPVLAIEGLDRRDHLAANHAAEEAAAQLLVDLLNRLQVIS
jgi:hypothetical protein